MQNIEMMKAVQNLVRGNFEYHYDRDTHPDLYDHWAQHWDELVSNPEYVIKGDCDDLACTVAEGLLSNGWPRDKLWLLLVSSKRTSTIDHMVTMAEAEDGKRYILGDTFRKRALLLRASRHKIIRHMRCDQPGEFYKWNKKGTV